VEREQINSRTATEYAKKTTAVAEHTSVITKLVPIYVPATVDPSCNLPGGFRVLHNTAVTRTPPLPVATGGADGAAVTPQEVASTVVENYNACHLNATKLEALQGWVREQLKVSASATLPN
jgi:hypothetical protein